MPVEYASLAPARTVHAIEPQGMHISKMKRQYGGYLPNLRPLKGALGSRDRTPSRCTARTRRRCSSMCTRDRTPTNASFKHINIHKLDTRSTWMAASLRPRGSASPTLTSRGTRRTCSSARSVSCSATGRPSRSNSRYARGTRARRASSPRRG